MKNLFIPIITLLMTAKVTLAQELVQRLPFN